MKKITVILAVVMLVVVTVCTTYFWTYGSVYRDAREELDGIRAEYEATYGDYTRLMDVIRQFEDLYVTDLATDKEEIVNTLIYDYLYMTGDLYADYYTPEELEEMQREMDGNMSGIGVQVSYDPDADAIQVFSVVGGSPAEAAGILPDDRITAVKDDSGVWQTVSERGYSEIVGLVSGEIGTTVELTVSRPGTAEPITFSIVRAAFVSKTVHYKTCDADDKIGYVRIMEFNNTTPGGFAEAFDALLDAGCDSIVVDLRTNPGGYLNSVAEVLDMILPEGPMVRTIDKDGNEEIICCASGDAPYVGVPIAVLVNDGTASAAELFSIAVQDYTKRGEMHATIVGTQTYGKGCMQTTTILPDGGAVKVTYRMFCGPYAPNFHGVGVTPDVSVAMTEKWATRSVYLVPEAEDNQLAAAIAVLHPAND